MRPDLGILSRANRDYGWTPEHARDRPALDARCGDGRAARRGAAPLAAAASRSRSRVAARACSCSRWTMTAQLAAALGSNSFSRDRSCATCRHRRLGRSRHRRRADALPRPEDRRRERPLAARVLEPLDQARLEPRRHGARARADGHARPAQPPTASSPAIPATTSSLAENSIDLVGKVVDAKGGWRLYRIEHPLRLALVAGGHLLRRLDRLTARGGHRSARATTRFETPGNRAEHDARHGLRKALVRRERARQGADPDRAARARAAGERRSPARDRRSGAGS